MVSYNNKPYAIFPIFMSGYYPKVFLITAELIDKQLQSCCFFNGNTSILGRF